jgi:exopolysaccharide biosynthesis polyprenyl glycosylphosphotransferase
MDIFNTLYRLNIIPFLKKWNLLNIILGALDILGIALAFQCSYVINYFSTGGFFFTDPRLLVLFLAITPFWLIVLYLIKVTEIPRTKHYRILFFEFLESGMVILFLLILFYFLFKLYEISRLFLIELTFFGVLFLFIIRSLEYKVFKSYRSKGFNQIKVVAIADDSSLSFIENLVTKKEWGYKLVAIFTGSAILKEKYEKTIIELPEEFIGVLNDLMEVDMIDEVLYLKKKIVPAEVREIVRSCEELGVTFRLKYKDSKINLTNAVKTEIADQKFLTFTNIPHNATALAAKKILDYFVSSSMIIILSPLLLLIAALIKCTSPGPVIYKQQRVGLRGRHFDLYKFRTMVANAENLRDKLDEKNEMDGPVFKMKDDPRITKVGKFLRKTGLDELPQLFNVLKGEMSLIGPRPPLQSETVQYKRWQLRRLSVKPGLSCFWQIKPDRNSIKFEQWMELDLAYIDNWSLRLDFLILIKTIKTVFQRTGL